MTVAVQRREQIVEDTALAGLDLGDDGHPRRQLEGPAVYHETLLFKGDARGIDELMGALNIRRVVARALRALAALLL